MELTDTQFASLVEGLRKALARPGEHRLFKAGKLDGLFPSRTGADIATFALSRGLIEMLRTDIRGKVRIEWVGLTPEGVEFVHRHDTPKAILEELHDTLTANKAGIPEWLGEFSHELATLGERVAVQLGKVISRLEVLDQRVERALQRIELESPQLPEETARLIPWGTEALVYLDRRADTGVGKCPLPELFAAMERQYPMLSVADFQDGLRRMAELKAVTLLEGEPDEAMLPEFAMLRDGKMMYHAKR